MMLLYVSAMLLQWFSMSIMEYHSGDEGNFQFGGQSLAKTLDYKAIK